MNWKLHKRDIDAGRAQPFEVANFEAAVRRNEEQRDLRHAKRADKRRQKASRGPTPRRRLLTKKDLTKKGTARKAPARNASSTPSSATEKTPRKQTTPLFEPSGTSESVRLKRKRFSSSSRSSSPALSVHDVSVSQDSLFNDSTNNSSASPRKSPSSHSTSVPKRARVTDPPVEKDATKQKSGTSHKGMNAVSAPYILRLNTTPEQFASDPIAESQENLKHAKTQLFPTNSCKLYSALTDSSACKDICELLTHLDPVLTVVHFQAPQRLWLHLGQNQAFRRSPS